MAGPFSHLLERLPHFKERIEALAGSNAAFDEVAREHHEVCDSLSAGAADEPGEQDRLEKRRAALEEEMVRMLGSNIRS